MVLMVIGSWIQNVCLKKMRFLVVNFLQPLSSNSWIVVKYQKIDKNLFNLKWKHTMGEPRLLSHCIVFWGSHNWTSTMSLLWRIFTMFLHIMVSQNPKKSNAKEATFFFISYDVMLKYIFVSNKYVTLY
jgi:hypothetical protein